MRIGRCRNEERDNGREDTGERDRIRDKLEDGSVRS